MAYTYLADNLDPVIRESESLVEIISNRAVLQPQHVVYRYLGDGINETESFTYKEIDRVARSVAQELAKKLVPGDRMVLLFPQGLQYIAALYGMAETTLIVTSGDPASEPEFARVNQEALSKNRLVFVTPDEKGIDLVSNGHAQFGFQWHVSYFMLNPTIHKLAEDGMKIFNGEME